MVGKQNGGPSESPFQYLWIKHTGLTVKTALCKKNKNKNENF